MSRPYRRRCARFWASRCSPSLRTFRRRLAGLNVSDRWVRPRRAADRAERRLVLGRSSECTEDFAHYREAGLSPGRDLETVPGEGGSDRGNTLRCGGHGRADRFMPPGGAAGANYRDGRLDGPFPSHPAPHRGPQDLRRHPVSGPAPGQDLGRAGIIPRTGPKKPSARHAARTGSARRPELDAHEGCVGPVSGLRRSRPEEAVGKRAQQLSSAGRFRRGPGHSAATTLLTRPSPAGPGPQARSPGPRQG